MASSKNSKTEQKSEAASSFKTAKKAAKPRKEKNLNKKNKSNKNKLGNSNVKEEDREIVVPSSSTGSREKAQEEGRQDDKTEITNGRTSATKPKKDRVKGIKHDDEDEAEGKGDAKGNVFPMNRIRTIIRGQDLDLRISQEAIFVINRATEMLLEQFTRDTYATCVRDRKKSLAYKHLSSVVSKQSRYDFLSDFVPEKIKAEDALRERNSGVNVG
ncbi:DNA polymerase II subunit B3-1 [Prosopis cineraria]|uniref:DNA polymerase II subunit B3-1 n=1 Tax=Prosopis cineraria TaxID=364024 RepID=UPI00240FD0B4|nr:DNA polymerase II subunit B3-1 [Prosopis cineraria]